MNSEIIDSIARKTGAMFVVKTFSDRHIMDSIVLKRREASQAIGEKIIVRFDDDLTLLKDFKTCDVARLNERVLEVEQEDTRGTEGVNE